MQEAEELKISEKSPQTIKVSSPLFYKKFVERIYRLCGDARSNYMNQKENFTICFAVFDWVYIKLTTVTAWMK